MTLKRTRRTGLLSERPVNLSENRQVSHGASFQLNWTTETNVFVAGYTYDTNSVSFRQSQQLGFIGADRDIFLDPERPAGSSFQIVSGLAALFDINPALYAFRLSIAGFPPDTTPDELLALGLLGSAVPPTAQEIFRNGLEGSSDTHAVFLYDVITLFDTLISALVLAIPKHKWLTTFNPIFPFHFGNSRRIFSKSASRLRGSRKPTGSPAMYQRSVYIRVVQSCNWNYLVGNPRSEYFAGVSRGTRVPSAIELACARDRDEEQGLGQGKVIGCTIPTSFTNDPFLEQVRSTAYEFGGRGALPSNIAWNAALFQTDIENDILFISLGRGNLGVFDNFGRTRRRGVEIGINRNQGRLRWFTNYTYLEATFETPSVAVNRSNSTANQQLVLRTNLRFKKGM